MRRYFIHETIQTRDLGGYPTRNPEHPMTAFRRLLRSDAPRKLSEQSLAFLRETCPLIIDLRSDWEYERRPSILESQPGFVVLHKTVEGGLDLPPDHDLIPEYYMGMVEAGSLPGIFAAIAEAQSGVLFHCAMGKDRTGVVSALLLELAEVADSDIIADYQVSSTYVSAYFKDAHEDDPVLSLFPATTKPEYMEGFLNLFHEKYGSTESYLRENGLSKNQIKTLQKKLWAA